MKKLLLILALISTSVFAVDPTLEPTSTIFCTNPIEREDGTPLAIGEIAELRFYSGTVSGSYSPTPETNTVCSLLIDNTAKPDGTTYYVITAVDTDGRESAYSTEKVYTVQRVKPPKPPAWI